MNKYSSEGWVKKVRGTYPKEYSTSYQDYGYFAKPPIRGWLSADPTKTNAASQRLTDYRLSRPRRLEDHDDIRLLHYPDYYNMHPLAHMPRHPKTGYIRRRAHPGVRLAPLNEEEVEPVPYPSHNYHIRNHLAQMGECLCKFPARPYKDAGAGDPKFLHPVTGKHYKGTPMTWCHFHPQKTKAKPPVSNNLFNTTFREPWNHSYVSSKIHWRVSSVMSLTWLVLYTNLLNAQLYKLLLWLLAFMWH